jgi:hypothetical protein
MRIRNVPDLNQLERDDDEALRRTGRAASEDGQLLVHLGLAGQRLERLPPEVVRRAGLRHSVSPVRSENERDKTYNLVARCERADVGIRVGSRRSERDVETNLRRLHEKRGDQAAIQASHSANEQRSGQRSYAYHRSTVLPTV